MFRLGLFAAMALTLAACEEQKYRGSQRHWVPISSELYGLMSEKGVRKDDPILIRSFKKESELEVWKRNRAGQYVLLKTYGMCRWSGQLGPKKREGDRMAPEGFYSITQGQLNPNSAYYLSYNIGYPNAYDRAHGRTGSLLMVHGACSSAGCYSMTDDQIAEIYALAREALNGGQKAIQMQALPFRMTPDNIAKLRLDQNMPFWKNLKEGADLFEVTKQEPAVTVCKGRYAFGTEAGGMGGECDVKIDASIASAASSKRQQDESKVAELVAKGIPAVQLVYADGDQHHSFKQILAQAGEDGLNAKASWASRDVGISRSDGLVSGPRVVVLDGHGKPRGSVQSASSDGETIIAAAKALDEQKQQEAEAAKAKTADTKIAAAPAASVAAGRVAGQVVAGNAKPAVSASTVIARNDPVAAVAPSAPPAEDKSVLQRVMSFNPFGGSSQPAAAAQEPVESVVPATPQPTLAPLPPRRASLTSPFRVAQPASATTTAAVQ